MKIILAQLHHNYRQPVDIAVFMGATKMSMGTTK
jgi:hypothetical protein